MTSSMMAGERRWASSARRGGLTSLGKVAVPKPLNLPSQRLENHGLDPNVEIVPKGTLSWGSRSSSSASNAWGSSTLSPTGSPGHLNGRPSSGGSGTRPSTAGSDRTHEPAVNAWGPNSRPSSASGALTSNQTSLTSSRPRSAETRPVLHEKLGVAFSKNDGFSLSSGDFPTLGSERDDSGRNTESQDHGSYGRPGSSSGKVAPAKEKSATPPAGDVSANANGKSGTANTWKRDGSQHVEDGARPIMEKWQGDPPPYLNANVPPQLFDAWHGPPINAPTGVWYRGPPGGPPYVTPVAPGGFPIEPFPYYHPQIPAAALANSQPVHLPGPGPRGPHPKNGDLYRPHIPDAFIRPGMPIRPGFYPGPVAYEGYYGPPMAYCNSNERDIPFMGMAAGPSVYNRYTGQNAPDPGNNHSRAGGHGSTGKTMVSEHVESGHPDDTRGPYKVLLKQQNEWDGKEEERKWEETVPANAPYLGKGDQPKASWKNEWGADHKKDEENYSRGTSLSEDVPARTSDSQGGYSVDSVKVKFPGSMGKEEAVDDSLLKKSENATSALPEVSQEFQSTRKDSTLIQKIEGLNAKARASDGLHDVAFIPSREEEKNMFGVDYKDNHSVNAVDAVASGDHIPTLHGVDVSAGDKTLQPAAASRTAISRRPSYGVQGRLDNRGKRFNPQDADGWRKKTLAAEGRTEGESVTPMFDPSDCQAQRAKMREIAKQRAKQLQEEEEERIREQKAKAQAKLEELNRRTQIAESSNQKLARVEPAGVGESTVLSRNSLLEPDNTQPESVPQGQPLPLHQDAHNAGVADCKAAPQVNDGSGVNRHKRMGYKPKQNIPLEKNMTDKLVPISTTEAPKNHTDVVVYDIKSIEVAGEVGPSESSLPINPNIMAEPLAHQRRKANRSVKNKHKMEDVPPFAALPSPVPKETNPSKAFIESGKSKASEFKLDSSPVQPPTDGKHSVHPSEQHFSLPSEESHGRVNNQWKPQHSRWTPRNPQANRSAEKFHSSDAVVWAPVRSLNKSEVTDEASHRTVPDAVTPTAKSDNLVQNSLKSKRAEMERYVPKPVAKELAQQGSMQIPVSSLVNQTTTDETVERTEPGVQNTESSQPASSAIGNVGSTAESRNDNSKQNKQSKAHGLWRQRVSMESPNVQGLQDRSYLTSNPGKSGQKSIDQHQSLMPDVISVKGQPKFSDDWNTSDGWNTADNSDTGAPVPSPVVKDQGVTGRGKRHPSKGHRSTGHNYNHDNRNINSGDTDRSYNNSAALEITPADKIVASRENRVIGEQTSSHWQPKSQAYSAHNQRGNRSSGGQNVAADVSMADQKDSAVHIPPQNDKDNSEVMAQPHPDLSVSEHKNVAEVPNVGQQEAKRERKVASFKGRPPSPNQGPVNMVEPAPPASMDAQHEQYFSSGFRKNGNQNNRSGRGHATRGEWSSIGQDNRQFNMPANRERQRHSFAL
ncbi:hypothetical protein F0562_024283 [Nyssa sinensis]|uniref:BAT2 N-terminal domain-containing protein n=1 Tax=Nyssa sinensis TaxID=561372 RepID=A0A5J5BDT9_9ASTE|nr:hypothetical protein F0562_024283 [Nyssa sinensis]